VVKGWTSFVPEVPKLWNKTRTDVVVQTKEKEVKDGLRGTDADDDLFCVPKALVQDEGELQKLVKTLEEKKRFAKKPGEKLIYFYYNSANLKLLSLDSTATCILVTNRRLIKIERGEEICSHDFIDLALVQMEEAAPGRFEKLILTLRNGSRAVVGVWSREVTLFLQKCLRKIAAGNDIDLSLVKTKQSEHDEKIVVKRTKPDSTRDSHIEKLTKLAGGRELTKDEQEFIKKEAAKREREDEKLDILNGVLDDVLQSSNSIKKELGYQEKILDHLDTRVGETTDRIKTSNRTIQKLNS